MDQQCKILVLQAPPIGLPDRMLTNQRRVFREAMLEKPSEIMMGSVFHEALSSRLRNRKFMASFQETKPMETEPKIAHIARHKTDYPLVDIDFAAERRPMCQEGGMEAYWIENKNGNLPGNAARSHKLVLLAEAKGVAIADKGLFTVRFSSALAGLAAALDLIAPNSKINPNYHLSGENGTPNEIAEILLSEDDMGERGTLKICIGDLSQGGNPGLARKKKISGTLFFMLEGGPVAQARGPASPPKELEKILDARFNQMEEFVRKIAKPEIAGGFEIYRCLKQEQL